VHGKTYQENKHVELAALADAVMAYAEGRVRMAPPLDRPVTEAELRSRVGETITPGGLGGVEAMRLFAQDLAPTCLSTDHPRYLSFIPCAPSDAAVMFDLVVGASSIYAGSWLEGSGAVYAENQALRWIADLVGMPSGAGGVFTPGGTIGNLSALVTARHTARASAKPGDRPYRVAATAGAHSSIASACDVMDAQFVGVPADDAWRLTGENLRAVLEENGPESFFAVVATCGTTNFGVIDDLASVAEVCREYGIWFHVDGAYGGAGLAAPSVRGLYAGIEHCDSFIVDADRPRARGAGLRTAVVEVCGRQGTGDQGTVRHVGHPLLPGAQRPHRQPVGAGSRPDAHQAAAPVAREPSASAQRAAPWHRRLRRPTSTTTPVREGSRTGVVVPTRRGT
jgi:L-2,4-diaminobutyrate decarboxylase